MNATTFAAETGSRGVLHPGRLLWLRAVGWLLLVFSAVALAMMPVILMLGAQGRTATTMTLLDAVLMTAAAVAVYLALVRLGERRWPRELDPRRLPELGAGLVLGAALLSAVMGLLVLFDWYDLKARGVIASPVVALALTLQSAVVEEILLRGIVLRLLTRAFNVWWALAISSAFFGALHLPNPEATAFGALAIAIEAGVLLAAFYIWTGRLWLSIGVHATWNFFQGYVFGATVSGGDFGDSPMQAVADPADPELLTGGVFGPEATLAAILVCLSVAALVLWLARDRLRARPRAEP